MKLIFFNTSCIALIKVNIISTSIVHGLILIPFFYRGHHAPFSILVWLAYMHGNGSYMTMFCFKYFNTKYISIWF